ncbi:unnamed protein product [Fraxinus pennsylvanica]|uniref:Nucleoside diphosphate kinase-like domain-containing protein n=1 Tax=Fraxinus pennsylvanica TaxID=56036 RepID=A0AAD1Z111_9LAMI|nr:unnamed protein product [Fraxinus pennsylvanica]
MVVVAGWCWWQRRGGGDDYDDDMFCWIWLKEIDQELFVGGSKEAAVNGIVMALLSCVDGGYGAGMERVFIAIKPDGVQRGLISEIISRFERKGLQQFRKLKKRPPPISSSSTPPISPSNPPPSWRGVLSQPPPPLPRHNPIPKPPTPEMN